MAENGSRELERDDPFGGAYGGARPVRAGDFVFTSAPGGVTGLDEGVSRFAETFADQLPVIGESLHGRLARFGCTAADIVEATVWLHPSVDVEPGRPLDRLHPDVFDGHAPAVSIGPALRACTTRRSCASRQSPTSATERHPTNRQLVFVSEYDLEPRQHAVAVPTARPPLFADQPSRIE